MCATNGREGREGRGAQGIRIRVCEAHIHAYIRVCVKVWVNVCVNVWVNVRVNARRRVNWHAFLA